MGHVLSRALSRQVDDVSQLAPPAAEARGVVGRMYDKVMPWRTPSPNPNIAQDQWDAVTDWNAQLFKQTAPIDPTDVMPGHQGMKQLKEQFNQAYEQIWREAVDPQVAGQLNTIASEMTDKVGGAAAKRVGKLLSHYSGQLSSGQAVPGKTLEAMLEELKRVAKSKAGKIEGEAYGQAIQAIRASLPGTLAQALNTVDGQYAQYAVLRKANTYDSAAKHGGIFTPDQLRQASIVKDTAKKTRAAQGEATMQPQANNALEEINGLLTETKGLWEDAASRGGAVGGALQQ